MNKEEKEQLKELKRFKDIFAGYKIEVVCSIIEEITMHTHKLKKDIIQQVANKYHISPHTANFWVKQYNQDGVTALLDKQAKIDIVTQFLDNELKPYSEWSRSSLCEYLNKNKITVQGEIFDITVSQSFCREILKDLKSKHKVDMTNELNEIYNKNCGGNLIFVDYIKMPWKQNLPSYNYEFIIFYDNSSTIKKISKRCERQADDNEIVAGFKDVISYLQNRDLLNEENYIVLRDNMITRKIMDFYKKEPYNVNIIVGKGKNLDPDLKNMFYVMNKDKLKDIERHEDEQKARKKAFNKQ